MPSSSEFSRSPDIAGDHRIRTLTRDGPTRARVGGVRTSERSSATIVELDIFSGRPNPRWELSPAEVERLRGLHHVLRPASSVRFEAPGLGYRGFGYRLDGTIWQAYHGFVSGTGQVLADPGSRIERLLLATTPAEYGELVARIRDSVDND